MQDRFRFRVWDKFCETWLTDFAINQDGEINKFFNSEEALKRRFVLMQSTGLKDKNGKLIYEGDIVEAKQKPDREGWYCVYRGIVKYDNKNCQYVINSNQHKVLNENKLIKSVLNTDTSFNWFDWFEIIGNIYENKELLEQ